MTIQEFADLGLSERLLRALRDNNYQTPTPIQSKAIPLVIDGRDLLGIAQTGTGKTAAFTLPLLQRLIREKRSAGAREVRAMVLAPTRELVIQIADSVRTYGRHVRVRHAVVMGGVKKGPQIDALRRGIDVLVATPGRLLELIQEGHADLGGTNHLILDEADRMLDMGFIADIRRIIKKLPRQRQTLLFSATMPKEIGALASDILDKPERVEIAPQGMTVDRIDQRVHHVAARAKHDRLKELLDARDCERAIVFTRTKRGADKVVKRLTRDGFDASALHGNKSHGARQRTLSEFRDGRLRVLVATDIASRGIDVDDVTHVINYELPNEPESYVHRIGRTARAGNNGVAISLCDESERTHLRSIERLIRRPLEVVGEAPEMPATPANRRDKKVARDKTGPGGPKRAPSGARKRRNRTRRPRRQAA